MLILPIKKKWFDMILSGEMTDEEKAEEYVNSNGFGSDYNDIESYDANEEIRQAYLDGLAEGRKARALEEKQRGQND